MCLDSRSRGAPVHWLSEPPGFRLYVPPDYVKSVVYFGLTRTNPAGEEEDALGGTGFLVGVPSETNPMVSYRYLVTAAHVAIHLTSGTWLRYNTADGGSAKWPIPANQRWCFHDDADVAVFPWGPPDEGGEFRTIPVAMVADDNLLRGEPGPEADLGLGNETLTIGLYTRLQGTKRNTPIARTGTIAMIPEERYEFRLRPGEELRRMEVYLCEMRSIGGLSGAPVFVLYPKTGYFAGHSHFSLLGLVHGHWDVPAGTIVGVDVPINEGIAVVVPAKAIMEVINSEELMGLRRRRDEERPKSDPATPDSTFDPQPEPYRRQDFLADLKKIKKQRPEPPSQSG